MADTNGSRTAVILSGGGATGAYEAGVLKALFTGASPATGYKPLAADVFTGTSVGSFNAAFMVSQPETDSSVRAGNLEDCNFCKTCQKCKIPLCQNTILLGGQT
jgi:predicted acylesterase/phospholipase RssA